MRRVVVHVVNYPCFQKRLIIDPMFWIVVEPQQVRIHKYWKATCLLAVDELVYLKDTISGWTKQVYLQPVGRHVEV